MFFNCTAPEVTDNGRKASGGKKCPNASAANKEKQKEKERKREERQQHRNVLAEQNTLLLSRMVDVENSEVDDNFDDDLVHDCIEILQSHPNSASSPTTNSNSTPRRPPTSINTPIQNQQQRQHLQRTPHSSQPLNIITPLQSVQRQPLQSITVSPHEMPINPRQPKPHATPYSQDEARPKFGGKCPRRRQLSNEFQEESDGCSSCKRLKQEVQDLRRQLDAYEGQNGKDNVVNSECALHTCTATDTLQCSFIKKLTANNNLQIVIKLHGGFSPIWLISKIQDYLVLIAFCGCCLLVIHVLGTYMYMYIYM